MTKALLALYGGDAMTRVITACKLRRKGLSVHAELQNRKRSKAHVAAKAESDNVLDMDSVEDQEELCYLLAATHVRLTVEIS